MPQRKIEIHPEAAEEGRAAYLWYRERNPDVARAFLAELDRAMTQISENPDRWPNYLEDTRRFMLRRFPFFVVFRQSKETVQILAIVHGRRRPGYWKDRDR
jgi:plasmid stabilization system protein ParE